MNNRILKANLPTQLIKLELTGKSEGPESHHKITLAWLTYKGIRIIMAINTWAMIQWNDFKILSNTIDPSKKSSLRGSFIWKTIFSSRKGRLRSWWRKTRLSRPSWDKRTESSSTWEPSKTFKNSSCSLPSNRSRGSYERKQLKWNSLRRSSLRKGKRMIVHRTSRTFRYSRQEKIRLRFSKKMSHS